MDETEALEQQAHIEALNNQLVGWGDIYNGLRGNPDFDRRAVFIWKHVIEGVYKQEMPNNAQLSLEITEGKFNSLQANFPKNVRRVDDGTNIKFYLNVDKPAETSGNDPKTAGKVDIYAQGGGNSANRFGLNFYPNGARAHSDGVLTPNDILGFSIQPKPSPLATTL